MLAGGYAALILATLLFLGILFAARPAHAQSTSLFPNGVSGPNIDFGDNFPFGYGGGPRTPTPPDTAGIIDRVFTRINAIFNRLFNR